MAGTLLAGQLTAPAVCRGVRYSFATPADDAAIRRLMRETPMHGMISLSFEREPAYLRGAGIAGADDHTILAREGDRLLCMGRSTTRLVWLNGEIRRATYLGELRLAATARGRFDILRHGYRFYHELHRRQAPDFTFTSIAADNHRARRFLERGLPSLPRYTLLTEFITLVIAARPGRPACRLESANPGELAGFFNSAAAAHQLAAAWTPEHVTALVRHGLLPEHFYVVRDDGRIVAAAGVWDQRGFRQTVIHDYWPPLALLRPALNLLARLRRGPRLPPAGSTLAHAFLSPLAIAPGSEGLLAPFVASLAHVAHGRGLDYLTLGGSAADPRLGLLRKNFAAREYATRLYRVTWPDEPEPLALEARPFSPEVALL